MSFILCYLSLHSSGLFFLRLITSWHFGQVQSPLKDVHSVWNLIKFLEVRAIQLPGRWERPMTETPLRESEAEYSCLAAARGQSLCTLASQTTQMNGLAKLSQSSSTLAAAQAVSCPWSVFHNRWQMRGGMEVISGRSSKTEASCGSTTRRTTHFPV